jgi:hypothetical protein
MTLWSLFYNISGRIVAGKRLIFWKMELFLHLATLTVGETSAVRGRNPLALVVAGVFLPRNRTLHVSSRPVPIRLLETTRLPLLHRWR